MSCSLGSARTEADAHRGEPSTVRARHPLNGRDVARSTRCSRRRSWSHDMPSARELSGKSSDRDGHSRQFARPEPPARGPGPGLGARVPGAGARGRGSRPGGRGSGLSSRRSVLERRVGRTRGSSAAGRGLPSAEWARHAAGGTPSGSGTSSDGASVTDLARSRAPTTHRRLTGRAGRAGGRGAARTRGSPGGRRARRRGPQRGWRRARPGSSRPRAGPCRPRCRTRPGRGTPGR